MLSLIIFIIALSIIIFIHELGHFLAAKINGVKVEEFGLGYPPRIFGKKIKGTIYSLNWIPFGGFVRIFGLDEPFDYQKSRGLEEDSFFQKRKSQRALIISAGILMNLILSTILFSIVFGFLGVPQNTNKIKVIDISQNSPAEKAGLLKDDVILEIEGKKIFESEELIKETRNYLGKEISLKISRESEGRELERLIKLTPRQDTKSGEGPMGVVISSSEPKFFPWWQMPFRSFAAGAEEAFFWIKLIVVEFSKGIFNFFSGKAIGFDLSGPIGVYKASSEVAKAGGILALIHFFGILSANLAVLNFLPFPALDGGYLAFIAYEAVFRKKPNQKVQRVITNLGFAILISLMILVTLKDIKSLF